MSTIINAVEIIENKLKVIVERLPDPSELLAVADWLDMIDTERGYTGKREVQEDIRKWAANLVEAHHLLEEMSPPKPQ